VVFFLLVTGATVVGQLWWSLSHVSSSAITCSISGRVLTFEKIYTLAPLSRRVAAPQLPPPPPPLLLRAAAEEVEASVDVGWGEWARDAEPVAAIVVLCMVGAVGDVCRGRVVCGEGSVVEAVVAAPRFSAGGGKKRKKKKVFFPQNSDTSCVVSVYMAPREGVVCVAVVGGCCVRGGSGRVLCAWR